MCIISFYASNHAGRYTRRSRHIYSYFVAENKNPKRLRDLFKVTVNLLQTWAWNPDLIDSFLILKFLFNSLFIISELSDHILAFLLY